MTKSLIVVFHRLFALKENLGIPLSAVDVVHAIALEEL